MPNSLGLLPSGPDPVGERRVRRQPPEATISPTRTHGCKGRWCVFPYRIALAAPVMLMSAASRGSEFADGAQLCRQPTGPGRSTAAPTTAGSRRSGTTAPAASSALLWRAAPGSRQGAQGPSIVWDQRFDTDVSSWRIATVFLGLDDDKQAGFAVAHQRPTRKATPKAAASDDTKLIDLRSLAAQGILAPRELGHAGAGPLHAALA